MATTASENYMSLDTMLGVSCAMIGLASIFMVVRIGIRIARPKTIVIEDGFLLFAYLTFLAMSIMYVAAAPNLYRISDAMLGKTFLFPTIMQDAKVEIRIFFANTLLFWTSLWLVKAAFLVLYRRLMGQSKTFMKCWWTIVVFSFLTLVGAYISNFLSCSSMYAWFQPGACSKKRDQRAQIISLYYAFAVDVTTDLLIMILPISVLWNMKMEKSKKLSIGALFCLGWICILAAVIRLIAIGIKSGSNATPSSSWLAMWGVVEAAITIVAGTCPALWNIGLTTPSFLRSGTFRRLSWNEKKAGSTSSSKRLEPYIHPCSHCAGRHSNSNDRDFRCGPKHFASVSAGSALRSQGTGSSLESSRNNSIDEETGGPQPRFGEIYVTRDYEVRQETPISSRNSVAL